MRAHTDNDIKVSYALQVFITYAVVVLLAGRVTLNFQLAFGVFMIFQLWGIQWIKILTDSPNIYSVRVTTTFLNDWLLYSIPSGDGLKIRKNRPVTSISELCGIRGTQLTISLRVMTSTINMLTAIAIQADLHARNATFGHIQSSEDLVPIFLFIAIIGFFLTGHFELNNMDSLHSKGHYLGVLGIFLGSLALGFQQKWSFVSLILIGSQFGICAYWFSFCTKIPMKCDDLKIVTRNSKKAIGVELIMFYITNMIVSLTVYACGKNEGNIWSSPFLKN